MIHFDQITIAVGNRSVTFISWVCTPRGWRTPVNPEWEHDGLAERPLTYILSSEDIELLKKKGQHPIKLRKIIYVLKRAITKGVLERGTR